MCSPSDNEMLHESDSDEVEEAPTTLYKKYSPDYKSEVIDFYIRHGLKEFEHTKYLKER